MPTDRLLRWGILGCARIARRGLIPGIQGSSGGVLAAIASRSIDTAKAWAAEFGIPKAYGTYEDLLNDPEIDAVYVPLPNELHLPVVIAASEAGKHVLCEKPLALDSGQARTMVDACRSRSVVLMEAFMWRFQPRTLAVLEIVRSGLIGDLRLIRSSFSFPIDPGDWRLDPSRGGGSLWDVGCYGISTARLFAQAEPTSIKALAHFGPTNVDMSLASSLRFPNDVLALVDCSFEQPFRCAYELVGTKGSIDVADAYLPPDSPTALIRTGAGTEERAFDGRNQYAAMVDAFQDAVSNNSTLKAPAEDGLNQAIVLDAVLASARGQK